MKLMALAVVAIAISLSSASSMRAAAQSPAVTASAPASPGPLTFAPDGTLFAGDTAGASIFAFDLAADAINGAPGAAAVEALDQKLAAALGTTAREIRITDSKGGTDFVLMSNDARGVMKMPAAAFTNAPPIERLVSAETAGVKYETIASLRGVSELDRLDADRAIVIARGTGGLDLRVVPLP